MLAFALFEGLFAGMLVYVRALVGSSARADWQTWLPVVICCVVLVLCGAVVLTGKDRRPVPAVPVRPVDWVVVLLAFTTTGMLFYAMTDGPERFRAWSGPALLLGLITLMFGLVVAVARIRSRA